MTERTYSRRGALTAGVALLGGLAGCDGDGNGQATTEPETGTTTPTDAPTQAPTDDGGDERPVSDVSVGATQLGEGFVSPVAVETVPGDDRYYVVDQPGTVEVIEGDRVRPEPFLDLTDAVVDVSGYSEMGMLGLAFHPEYADNGRVFLRYSAPTRSETPGDYSHTFVLSELSANPDGGTVDVDSEQPLLEIPEPQPNHNAGAVAFGPDGYLYVGTGDGGAANDQGPGHVEDWYDGVGGGNGQDVAENLLGSILRIDVDGGQGGDTTGDRNYAIPDDNPLVDGDGLDEHYAWGFRNPWRFSFGPEGRLFVADVGQDRYEEVNVVERGGNYGWNVREGTECFQAEECPEETPDGEPLIDPVVQYAHENVGGPVTGVTIIGGYLYDGDAMPDLAGNYVFSDWQANGELLVASERDDGLWPIEYLPVEGEFGSYVLSFGRDTDGELLVCTTEEGGVAGRTGALYRLESV